MANIRLVALFTIVLVAIAPVLIQCGSSSESNEQLVARLAGDILPSEELQSIFKALEPEKNVAMVGQMGVHMIMYWAKYYQPKVGDCERKTILSYFGPVFSSDLNTVLNVCKYVSPGWMSSCKEDIERVYKAAALSSESTEQLLAKLAENILPIGEIRIIFEALEARDDVARIGQMRVDLIIYWARYNRAKLEDCKRETIMRYFSAVVSSDLNSVLNVCNYVNPDWMSACKEDIIRVHNEAVQELLDKVPSPPFKVEHCQFQLSEIRSIGRRGSSQQTNLPSFDEARRDQLFSFCAQNIRSIFETQTASVTNEAKERIRKSKAVANSASWNIWKRSREEIVKTARRDGIAKNCIIVEQSVANVMYIKHRAKTSLSTGLDELLGDEWKELDNACFYYLECYHYDKPLEGLREDICKLAPGKGKFSEHLQSLRRQAQPEITF